MTAVARLRPDPGPAELPHSIDAEQALLGAVMLDGAALAAARPLTAEHFYEPLHGRVWGLIEETAGRTGVVDVALIASRLGDDPAFRDLGGMRYIADLLERAPPPADAPSWANAVYEAALRRDVVQVCHEAARRAIHERDRPAFEVVAEARTALDHLETAAAPDDVTLVAAPAIARRAIVAMQDRAAHGRARGLMTGLRCVDRRLNGLKPGALVVIGGRPGMCKTGLARACAHGAAVRNPGHQMLFLSLEMEGEEMMHRELAALTHEAGEGIPYRTMESGAVTAMDFMLIEQAEARIPPNLIFDERCGDLSVDDVRRKVWALKRRGPVGAVFIDYLQLMRRPAANGRNEASVIAEMTRALKKLATEGKVCVVLLSQLNRSVEGRDDKRPQLSDLRESGSIEQDADAVLFPFREFYYLSKAEPKKTEGNKHLEWEMRCEEVRRHLDVTCAKQRGGPEGTDRQRYFAEFDFIEDDHERA